MVLPTGNRSHSVSCYEGRELEVPCPLLDAELPSELGSGDANDPFETSAGEQTARENAN
jgi:hypothetical protein